MTLSKKEIYYALIKYQQDAYLEKIKAMNDREIDTIALDSTNLNVKNFKTRDKKIVLAVLNFYGVKPGNKLNNPLGMTELNRKYHAFINE